MKINRLALEQLGFTEESKEEEAGCFAGWQAVGQPRQVGRRWPGSPGRKAKQNDRKFEWRLQRQYVVDGLLLQEDYLHCKVS